MNNYSFLPEYAAAQEEDEKYGKRSFQNIGGGISGRSVVIEQGRNSSAANGTDNMWPYSLTDYLKGCIGSMVLAEYVTAARGCSVKRGRLMVVGIDFIGIQSCRNNSIFLVEISSLKSIKILDCERSLRNAY